MARVPQAGRVRRQVLELPDGYATEVYFWPPAGIPAGLPVVYLHGIQSHPGWFSGSAEHLACLGYPVWQPTRRGSGGNAAGRGHASSAGQLLDDVAAACRAASADSGGRRVHLIGVSWGGKLAACFACLRRAELAGCRGQAGMPDQAGAPDVEVVSLTLVCPGVAPRIDIGPLTKLAVAASLVCCPRRPFDIPLNQVELFTDNETMRDYLRRDACRLHSATAAFMFASRQLDRILARAGQGCLRMPVTLILAERDRIIDNDATRRTVARLAGDRLETRLLPGCHTLEFEPDPQPLHRALADSLARAR